MTDSSSEEEGDTELQNTSSGRTFSRPPVEASETELDQWAEDFLDQLSRPAESVRSDMGTDAEADKRIPELIDPMAGPDEPDPDLNPDPSADDPPFGDEPAED